jgi:hypothetical protein
VHIFRTVPFLKVLPQEEIQEFWNRLLEKSPVCNHLPLWIWIVDYSMTKTKYRNKVGMEADLRVQMSSVVLDFRLMCH